MFELLAIVGVIGVFLAFGAMAVVFAGVLKIGFHLLALPFVLLFWVAKIALIAALCAVGIVLLPIGIVVTIVLGIVALPILAIGGLAMLF